MGGVVRGYFNPSNFVLVMGKAYLLRYQAMRCEKNIMGERILIRSSEARWPAFLLGGFGAVIMITGAVLGIVSATLWVGLAMGGIGLFMLFASFYIEAKRIRELMWITLETNRFTVIDNIGERNFADDDIVSIALQYKENFDNGNLKSTTRTFRTWLVASGDRPELIEMKSVIKIGQVDPLAPFINRIVTLLKERSDNERLKNQSVLGEGWELTGKTLILRDPKTGETETTLDEIAASMSIEDKLKLWKKGEDEAFAQLPLSAANAHILHLILQEELAKRPQTDKVEPTGQLGRIIFERKPKAGYAAASLIIAGLLGIGAIIMIVVMASGAANRNAGDAMIPLTIVCSFVALLLALVGWTMLKSLFRCHEFGVYQRSIAGEKRLLFSEVEAFTYSATRHYHNGAYIGTHLKMAFIPRKELNKSKLVYKTTVKNIDNSLDQMRDEIARMIGSRLYREVKEGKSVTWADTMTLEPALLRYKTTSLFSKNPPQVIAYQHISGHTLHQGTLSLFQRGKPKPFVTAGISAVNFFPGYFAFMTLWEEAKTQPIAPVAEAESFNRPDGTT